LRRVCAPLAASAPPSGGGALVRRRSAAEFRAQPPLVSTRISHRPQDGDSAERRKCAELLGATLANRETLETLSRAS